MTRKNLQLVYSEQQIQERLDCLGAEIVERYKGKPLVLVCVLKGAFMFFSDLVKRLDYDVAVDFVRVASYGNATESSRNISFTKDVEVSLKDKHVILVDDIVDSGHTMSFLLNQFAARQAASLAVAALLSKHERRETDVNVDFVGFELSEKGYIVGYGLDYAEQYRSLPAIYFMENPS